MFEFLGAERRSILESLPVVLFIQPRSLQMIRELTLTNVSNGKGLMEQLDGTTEM